MVPLDDGPRQDMTDLGVPNPGPLGGGSYTGRYSLGRCCSSASVGAATARTSASSAAPPTGRPIRTRLSTTPYLLVFDKATGETVHALELDVAPTGTPMTYLQDGRQFIVLAYGAANDMGLIALALE